LLSFITDFWTPRNVALMILTPPPAVKNSSRAPANAEIVAIGLSV